MGNIQRSYSTHRSLWTPEGMIISWGKSLWNNPTVRVNSTLSARSWGHSAAQLLLGGGSGPQLHSPHSYQELWQLWFMPLLYHCFHRTNLGTEYRRELPAASHQVIINTQGVMVLQLQGTRSPARDRLKPSYEKKRKPSPWLPQRSKKAEG